MENAAEPRDIGGITVRPPHVIWYLIRAGRLRRVAAGWAAGVLSV